VPERHASSLSNDASLLGLAKKGNLLGAERCSVTRRSLFSHLNYVARLAKPLASQIRTGVGKAQKSRATARSR
jgi:hypothetical protein